MRTQYSLILTACKCTLAGVCVGLVTSIILMCIVLFLSSAVDAAVDHIRTLHGAKEVKPWPWADTWPVNRLSVPALGVSRIVLAGTSGQALAFGPGRLFYSDDAGVPTSVIITGHLDTHFSFVRKIRYGDTLSAIRPNGPLRYMVQAMFLGEIPATGMARITDS